VNGYSLAIDQNFGKSAIFDNLQGLTSGANVHAISGTTGLSRCRGHMLKSTIACITAFLLVNTSACYSQSGYAPGQPSFDCSRVQNENTVAVILCKVPEAALADWELNSAWWARYFTVNDTQRRTLDLDQYAWRQSLEQTCALPRNQTREDQAGRAMAEAFGRIMLGPGLRIPGPQPITQVHVDCVVNAYHTRAAELRSKLTGDALAESLLSPKQHAEL
jgi:uncharacterized protein YecT (DUF1311 family)